MSHSSHLLLFAIAQRALALPVEQVVEVVRMVAITPLPDMPPWLAGMIVYRGQAAPVIDLRIRLGVPPTPIRLDTPIIVATVDQRLLALIVDSVQDVIAAPDLAGQAPDPLASQAPVIAALAQYQERLIIVLDLATLLSTSLAGASPQSVDSVAHISP